MRSMYVSFGKRFLDLLLSCIGVLILSPVLLLLTILLGIVNKGSPFFFQGRPGKNGKIFTIAKFKTMTDEVDDEGRLLPDFERITKLGHFTRKFSLDEIPQLFSIIKGDMSLVGPRPLLEQYLDLYTPEQMRRHNVRPGVTGWAQVNGRNAISWEEKFKYDLYYVNHMSFLLDIRILLLTVKKVFLHEGINSESDTTMTTFKGSNGQS